MNYQMDQTFFAGEPGPLINRRHKDLLFGYILADSKTLLKLYNALNGTDYRDESELTITTLTDVIYLGYKNDLSFIIGNTLSLYEHQSTVNPNMPLRGLAYILRIYSALIAENDENIYGTKLIRLPRPECIVFYNGKPAHDDMETLRLSDSFYENTMNKTPPCLEFTVTVLNINYGHNKGLLGKCRELEEYAIFNHKLRAYLDSGMGLAGAAGKAVDECISQNILHDILSKNKAEVINMILTTEYDREAHHRVLRNEGREEGREEGEELANKKWEAIVAGKDIQLADKDTKIADLVDEIKRLKELQGLNE